MDHDHLFELRVLTGTHAGARALLPDKPQVVGSSPECDLVLTDDDVLAQHARLEQQPDGSTVLRWLDGDLPPMTIRPGQGARIGSVHIVVDSADAPWRTDVPVCDASEAADESARSGSTETGVGSSTTTAVARARARLPALLSGGAAAVLIAGLTYVALGMRSPPAPAALPLPPAAVWPSADLLKAAVEPLALGNRVRIVLQPDGSPVVEASFLSTEEAELLTSALIRLKPRPKLKFLSTAELEAVAAAALQPHAAQARSPLSVRHVGGGRFRVEGRVVDARQREAILAGLAAAVPQASGFDSHLRTDVEAAEAMLDDLRGQGLPHVSGHWQGEFLSLEVALAPADVPRWERSLLQVASRHQVRFRATLQLVLVTPPSAPPPPVLPFTVRSIVGSDLPYVVLADGRKLVPGAKLAGWHLTEIGLKAVVFEDADRRRLTLER